MKNVVIIACLLFGAFLVAVLCGADQAFAGRVGISAVFFFTALGHFAKPDEMMHMLPAGVPQRRLVILVSGLFERAASGDQDRTVRSASRRPSSIFATKLPPNSTSTSQSHGSSFSASSSAANVWTNCLSFVLWERKTFIRWPIRLATLSLGIALNGRLHARKRWRAVGCSKTGLETNNGDREEGV